MAGVYTHSSLTQAKRRVAVPVHPNFVGGSICAPLYTRLAVHTKGVGVHTSSSSGHFPFKTVRVGPKGSILSSSLLAIPNVAPRVEKRPHDMSRSYCCLPSLFNVPESPPSENCVRIFGS